MDISRELGDRAAGFGEAADVDSKAESLLRRFVDKLGGEVQVSVRRDSGRSERWETSVEVHETVTGFGLNHGVVDLTLSKGQAARLHFEEPQLISALHGARKLGERTT